MGASINSSLIIYTLFFNTLYDAWYTLYDTWYQIKCRIVGKQTQCMSRSSMDTFKFLNIYLTQSDIHLGDYSK